MHVYGEFSVCILSLALVLVDGKCTALVDGKMRLRRRFHETPWFCAAEMSRVCMA